MRVPTALSSLVLMSGLTGCARLIWGVLKPRSGSCRRIRRGCAACLLSRLVAGGLVPRPGTGTSPTARIRPPGGRAVDVPLPGIL